MPRLIITPLLRLFFYLLYHPFCWLYDTVAYFVSLGKWKCWVLSIIPYIHGSNIIELGPGPGHLYREIAQPGRKIVAIDTSFPMCKLAKKNISNQNVKPGIVRGDVRNLPFPENWADQIVSTFPTEYIFRSQTLLEVDRVLKPSGSLIVLPGAWLTGSSMLERLAAWLFSVTGQSPSWSKEIFEILRQKGYEVKHWYHSVCNSKVLFVSALKPDREG